MPGTDMVRERDSVTRPYVFCIGLGRTGTTSLTQALGILGYHANHLPIDEITQREMYAYFANDLHTMSPLHLSILDEYNALADTPVCCVYQGLDKAYPGSKFILTVREKQGWLASQERLHDQIVIPFFSQNREAPDVRFQNFLIKTLVTRTIGDEAASIFTEDFEIGAFYDRDVFSRLYDAYYEQVPKFFAGREDQFLMLRIVDGEGWEKLAPFLGVDAPDEPFPFEMRLTRSERRAGADEQSDKENDRQIQAVRTYLDAFHQHDLSTCLDCFAEEAAVNFFDKRYEGRRGIETWHRDRFKAQIQILSMEGFESVDDTVSADLIIASKFKRIFPVKASGRAVIRLDRDKIKEIGFEGGRLIR